MILEKILTQICLDFGDGDIGSFGTEDTMDGAKRVSMWFYQAQKGEIDRDLDVKVNDVSHFPVVMTFRKKESLKVVIENLNELLKLFDE